MSININYGSWLLTCDVMHSTCWNAFFCVVKLILCHDSILLKNRQSTNNGEKYSGTNFPKYFILTAMLLIFLVYHDTKVGKNPTLFQFSVPLSGSSMQYFISLVAQIKVKMFDHFLDFSNISTIKQKIKIPRQ